MCENQKRKDKNLEDKLFIQEVINDLKKSGVGDHTKAMEMLTDWSRELREMTHLRGRTKKTHAQLVGKHLY